MRNPARPKIKRPPVLTAAQRELQAEWEALQKRHSAPLEKGAKAKGIQVVQGVAINPRPSRFIRSTERANSLPMFGNATKALPSADMIEAKEKLKSRIGISYNKGGLMYLTDAELEEQKTGAHRRRS